MVVNELVPVDFDLIHSLHGYERAVALKNYHSWLKKSRSEERRIIHNDDCRRFSEDFRKRVLFKSSLYIDTYTLVSLVVFVGRDGSIHDEWYSYYVDGDRVRAQQRKHYFDNKVMIRDYHKKYYHDNIDSYRARQKEHRKKNSFIISKKNRIKYFFKKINSLVNNNVISFVEKVFINGVEKECFPLDSGLLNVFLMKQDFKTHDVLLNKQRMIINNYCFLINKLCVVGKNCYGNNNYLVNDLKRFVGVIPESFIERHVYSPSFIGNLNSVLISTVTINPLAIPYLSDNYSFIDLLNMMGECCDVPVFDNHLIEWRLLLSNIIPRTKVRGF